MDGPTLTAVPFPRTQVPPTTPPNEDICKVKPTIPQCQAGIYSYVLNRQANAAFLLCFILLAFPLLCIVLAKRRAFVYSAALFAGLLFEIMGYAARYWSSSNQLQREPFYMQLVCLTVGPAFMAAAIYFCMRRVVAYCGEDYSFCGPEFYTRLFIPCDLVSLILQATGGAIAAAAHKAKDQKTLDKGTNVMIAGLAFQVFTMFVFIFLSCHFVAGIMNDYRRRVRQYITLPRNINAIRTSPLFKAFKAFIFCIFGSTLLIFIRCYYRVVELSGGWRGDLMKNQTLFIVCEGVFVLVATLLLTVGHPASTASMILDESGEFHSIRELLPLSCTGVARRRVEEGFGLRSVFKEIGQRVKAATPTEMRPSSLPQHEPVTPVEDVLAQSPSQPESQSSATVPPTSQPPPAKSSNKDDADLNLIRACIEGDLEYVNRELADRPQSLECRDRAGNSPLQVAAKSGQYKIVKVLMDKGCDIHGMNLDQDTPLLDAADNGHLEVVRLLLDAGVHPGRSNAKHQTPFDRVKGDSKKAFAIRNALITAREQWLSVASASSQKAERQSLGRLSAQKWTETENRCVDCIGP